MTLTLIDSNIPATPAMLAHVQARIDHALGRFADKVSEVRVHVIDTNGPKGGVDKVCSIHARVNKAPAIIVTHAAADYYQAVTSAARRLKATLGRTFSRRR